MIKMVIKKSLNNYLSIKKIILFFLISIVIPDNASTLKNDKFSYLKNIYSDSWAIIIGINEYEFVDPLSYAVNDAEKIRSILIDKYGFPEDNIKFLADEDATKDNILEAFNGILLTAQENDRVVVFYAGHGDTFKLPNGGDMGYLIPVDGYTTKEKIFLSSIAMSDFERIAKMSAAKHILYLVDACYGGLSLQTRGLGKEQTPEYLKKMTNQKGRQVITAGGKDEEVMEKAEWGHSAFTKNLISGLEDDLADANDDGIISGEELGTYIRSGVSIDTEGQHTPQKGRLGSDPGEFIFISQTLRDDVDEIKVAGGTGEGMGDLQNQMAAQQEQMAQITELLLAQANMPENTDFESVGNSSKNFKSSKKANSLKTASTLSFVFPGMGHFYSGRSGKGILFAGLEIAALAGLAVTSGSYGEKSDLYDTAYAAWENNKDDPNVSQSANQAAVTDAHTAQQAAYGAFIGAGTLSAGIWIWNIIDVKKSKSKYSSHDPVSIGINNRGQVEARISF